MVLHVEKSKFRPPVSNVACTDRKPFRWALSLTYAVLLAVAVWKLDGAAPRPPNDPASAVAPQSAPEGWPLWTGDSDERTARRLPDPVPDPGHRPT